MGPCLDKYVYKLTFFSCDVAGKVWYGCYQWVVLPVDAAIRFMQHWLHLEVGYIVDLSSLNLGDGWYLFLIIFRLEQA